jgi:hypothetical protein
MDGRNEFLLAAQDELEALYPATLGIGEDEFPCARGGEEWELERQRGGYDDESEARVRVKTALVPDRPEKNAAVTLDGLAYVVDDVSKAVGDVAWCLSLRKG